METNIIQKEEISKLRFLSNDVLDTAVMKNTRYYLLKQGETLGNAYKHKVRILFYSSEGRWAVSTTIWFATESHVQLKGGIMLPVRGIEDVVLDSI